MRRVGGGGRGEGDAEREGERERERERERETGRIAEKHKTRRDEKFSTDLAQVGVKFRVAFVTCLLAKFHLQNPVCFITF